MEQAATPPRRWGEAAERIGRLLEDQSRALDASSLELHSPSSALLQRQHHPCQQCLDGLVEEAVRDRVQLIKVRLDEATQTLWDELRELRSALRSSLAAVHGDVEELGAALARLELIPGSVGRLQGELASLARRVEGIEAVSSITPGPLALRGEGPEAQPAPGQERVGSLAGDVHGGLEALREAVRGHRLEADAIWAELGKCAGDLEALWQEMGRTTAVLPGRPGTAIAAPVPPGDTVAAAVETPVLARGHSACASFATTGSVRGPVPVGDGASAALAQPHQLPALGSGNAVATAWQSVRLDFHTGPGCCSDVAARAL